MLMCSLIGRRRHTVRKAPEAVAEAEAEAVAEAAAEAVEVTASDAPMLLF